LKGFDVFAEIARLAVPFDEFGFVIEEVKMARRTRHEKLHDAPGLCGMMEFLREAVFFAQHCRQRETAETAARLPEEGAARSGTMKRLMMGSIHIHPHCAAHRCF
jgi:hypothetical protein